MTVRFTEGQAQTLGLLPKTPVRRGRKTETADGHGIDPAYLGVNEEGKGEFRDQVMALVHRYGWSCGYRDEGRLPGLCYHASSAMHQAEAGWPDLTLVRRRDRRLIFAELKRENGELSSRQAAVLDLLRCLERDPSEFGLLGRGSLPTVQVFVWRPSQLAGIEAVLR